MTVLYLNIYLNGMCLQCIKKMLAIRNGFHRGLMYYNWNNHHISQNVVPTVFGCALDISVLYFSRCSVMDSNNSNTSDYLAPFIFAKCIIFLIILYFRIRWYCCNNNDNNDRLCCNNNDDNEEHIRTEGYYNLFCTNYNIKKWELKTWIIPV